jgi:DNA-binding beta-propeller fold protein YncE
MNWTKFKSNSTNPSDLTAEMESFLTQRRNQRNDYYPLNHATNTNIATPKPKTKLSRIRVELSRPLTIAESEHLTRNHHTLRARVLNAGDLKLRVNPNGTHVWVDAAMSSRALFDIVRAALDSHFVNVFPRAVRTFTEYNGQ